MENQRVIILEAGLQLLMQNGFKGLSMEAIALAADVPLADVLSEFETKEALLDRIIRDWGASAIAEIRSDLSKFATLDSMLILVFDVWVVRPFELIGRSPGASDLFDSSLQSARGAVDANFDAFVSLLTDVLRSESQSVRNQMTPPGDLAYLLAKSVVGYRPNVKNTQELRTLITGLVELAVRRGRHTLVG